VITEYEIAPGVDGPDGAVSVLGGVAWAIDEGSSQWSEIPEKACRLY
jgi:hypothetical protein